MIIQLPLIHIYGVIFLQFVPLLPQNYLSKYDTHLLLIRHMSPIVEGSCSLWLLEPVFPFSLIFHTATLDLSWHMRWHTFLVVGSLYKTHGSVVLPPRLFSTFRLVLHNVPQMKALERIASILSCITTLLSTTPCHHQLRFAYKRILDCRFR
jgi:hypothetical protein